MNEANALSALSAISSETRLRIFKKLVAAGSEGLSAGEIAAQIGATPSRASFHLSNLAEAGLLKSTRQSRQVTYHADFVAMGSLIRYLLEDCCGNNETVLNCCRSSPHC